MIYNGLPRKEEVASEAVLGGTLHWYDSVT